MGGVPSHPDVMILGLDGADPELVEQWCAEGHLPTIARLKEQGTVSPIRSTIPPTTAPAWTTVLTGVNEGKHGIYDFRHQKPGTYQVRLVHAGLRAAPTIWHYLSQAQVSFACLEVPGTYPPENLPGGVMVAGWDKPAFGPEACSPPQLHTELVAAGVTRLDDYHPVRRQPLDWGRFLATLEERIRLAAHVSIAVRPRVFMQVLTPTDHFAHQYFGLPSAVLNDGSRLPEPLRQVYQAVDRTLGELLRCCAGPDTNLILLSDHGFRAEDYIVNLSAWLRENGYLKARATGNLLSARLRRFFKLHLPYALRHALIRTGLGRAGEGLGFAAQFDWDKTVAFCWGASWARIRLNVRGREPKGTVAPGAEYERLREEIIGRLQQLVHPQTGRPVFERLWRREELYHGPRAEEAPDIVGQPAPGITVRSNLYDPRIPLFFEKTPDNLRILEGTIDMPTGRGDHNLYGTLILHGPAFKQGSRFTDLPTLMDIAPLVLYLVDLGIPDYMDGRVPTEVLTEHWLQAHPLRGGSGAASNELASSDGYTDEEQERVAQRLRNLGYF